MCIYDSTRYACTGEEITLVQSCPMRHAYCIPHIRQTLFRTAVCRLCAIAGLEEGAVITMSERYPMLFYDGVHHQPGRHERQEMLSNAHDQAWQWHREPSIAEAGLSAVGSEDQLDNSGVPDDRAGEPLQASGDATKQIQSALPVVPFDEVDSSSPAASIEGLDHQPRRQKIVDTLMRERKGERHPQPEDPFADPAAAEAYSSGQSITCRSGKDPSKTSPALSSMLPPLANIGHCNDPEDEETSVSGPATILRKHAAARRHGQYGAQVDDPEEMLFMDTVESFSPLD